MSLKMFVRLSLSVLFLLFGSYSCQEIDAFYCQIQVMDDEQQIPSPAFHFDDKDETENTVFGTIRVRDRETQKIVWEMTGFDGFLGVTTSRDFVYGEEIEGFRVDTEPVPLEKGKEYSLYVESILCDDHAYFVVDDDGYLIEHDD